MSNAAVVEKVESGLKFMPNDGDFVGQNFVADSRVGGDWNDVWKCKGKANFFYVFQEADILRWVNG